MAKLRHFIYNNKGLVLLFLIVTVIAVLNLKPNLNLAGWDNFSVSLDLWINFKRTLFSTWREYRGMGVPSDSEVADITRIIILLFLDLFFKNSVIDQILLYFLLLVGTFATYFLYLEIDTKKYKTGATIAALFYVFNISTLSTFFLPMIMFPYKFAFFPLIILFYFKYLTTNSPGVLFYFALISIFAGPAYLTATNFFVLLLILGIIFLFTPNKVAQLKLWLVILLANSYWLLPFTNYYFQKSQLIPLASTYVHVNEIKLNEGPEQTSWFNVLTLQPDFSNIKLNNLKTSKSISLHPTLGTLEFLQINRSKLIIYAIMYLAALGYVLVRVEKRFFWIVANAVLFILISRKYAPPLGGLYAWLSQKLPFFEIIFRFPDTKFYQIISLCAALLIGLALSRIIPVLYNKNGHKIKLALQTLGGLIIIGAIGFYMSFYTSFFSRKFVNPLVLSKIPQAYFQVANYINADTDEFKVVHLPYEVETYWRPYSWGYVGSTFLSFILDKPLIEKTFIPASIANDSITTLISQNSKNYTDNVQLEKATAEVLAALRNSNTKYVIWDTSVQQQVPTRGKLMWGKTDESVSKMHTILLKLVESGALVPVWELNIDLQDFYDLYDDFNSDELSAFTDASIESLLVYQVSENAPLFEAIESAVLTKTHALNTTSLPTVQNSNFGEFYPFKIENYALEGSSNESVRYSHLGISGTFTYLNNNPLLTIYAKSGAESYELIFKKTNINSQEAEVVKVINIDPKIISASSYPKSEYISDWHIIPFTDLSNLRLVINQLELPLPYLQLSQEVKIGTVLTYNGNVDMKVVKEISTTPIDLTSFTTTLKPDCFNDKTPQAYDTKLDISDKLNLYVKDGSTCIITTPIKVASSISEVKIDLSTTIKDTQEQNIKNLVFDSNTSQYQKQTREVVTSYPKLDYADLCLMSKDFKCLNNHKSIKLSKSGQKRIILPTTRANSTDEINIIATFATNTSQEIRVQVDTIDLLSFEDVLGESFSIPATSELISLSGVVNLPKILSTDSYYYDNVKDSFLINNTQCESGFRTTRNINNRSYVYTEDCGSGLFNNTPREKDRLYLINYQYNVLSGKQTQLNAGTNFNKYMSLATGYPFLNTFQSLKKNTPFELFNKNKFSTNLSPLESLISNAETIYGYGIAPNATSEENFLISVEQERGGQGLYTLQNLEIIPLPKSYFDMAFVTANPQLTFSQTEVLSFKRILPSLWQVQVSTTSDDVKDTLLAFNQEFDTQWKLLGVNIKEHVMVNGTSNGWIIEANHFNKNGPTVLYVFYYPELYALAGFVLTLALVFILLRKTKTTA